jgi:hypothetical protein
MAPSLRFDLVNVPEIWRRSAWKNMAVNAAKMGAMLRSLSSGTLRVLPRAAPLPVTL